MTFLPTLTFWPLKTGTTHRPAVRWCLLVFLSLATMPATGAAEPPGNQLPRLEVRRASDVVGVVSAISCAPDGGVLAAATWPDSRIGLWDLKTATLIRELRGHKGAVHTLCFSPDGTQLASGGDDQQVCVWSVATGALTHALHALPTDNGSVSRVWFSPNGRRLVTGLRYNPDGKWHTETVVWDLAKETPEVTLPGAASPAFRADGVLLTVAVPDGATTPGNQVRLTNLDGGSRTSFLLSAPQPIYTLACAPAGTALAVGSYGEVRFWASENDHSPKTVSGRFGDIWRLVFAPDGRRLAFIDEERRVWLIDTQSGTVQGVPVQREGARAVVFSPQGSFLALGGEAVEIRDPTGQTVQLSLRLIPSSGETTREWVVYTPEGYLRKSAAAGRFLQWRVGEQVVPFDTYAREYERPEVVMEALGRERNRTRAPDTKQADRGHNTSNAGDVRTSRP